MAILDLGQGFEKRRSPRKSGGLGITTSPWSCCWVYFSLRGAYTSGTTSPSLVPGDLHYLLRLFHGAWVDCSALVKVSEIGLFMTTRQ